MQIYSSAGLSEQLFQHLLQRHFQEREKGREFFFGMEPGSSNRIFLADTEKITLTFWDNPAGKIDSYWLNYSIYLQDGQTCFWIPFHKSENKLLDSICRALKMQRNEKLKRWERLYPSISSCLNALDRFLDEDYAAINTLIVNFTKIEKTTAGDLAITAIAPFQFEAVLNNVILNRNMTHDRRVAWGQKGTHTGILSFEFWNFRGIQHLSVSNIRPDAGWIFVTGENGFGKSSVLQALALGLTGTDELSKNEIGDNWLIAVELFEGHNAWVNALYGRQAVRGYEPKKNFAAYGSARLQISQGTETLRKNDRTKLHLFNLNLTLLNIENELKLSKGYRNEQYKYIVELILKLIPDIADVSIRSTGHYEEVVYLEKDREGGTYRPVTYNQLASGFRSLIAFVGDMYLRLSAGRDKVTPPDEMEGIVLIDEIELHLHPKYQKMLPGKLSELFPKVQFIASTHSPIPLLGAPKNTVVLTVNRTPEEGITVSQVDIDLSTLLPNAILTSPVFGFDEVLPAAATDPDDVETADTYSEAKELQRLKEKLGILKAKMGAP